MNDDERRHFADRLIEMQKMLRTVFEACDSQGACCREAGVYRLAFAIAMVKESLVVYSKELNLFTLKVLAGEEVDEDEVDLFGDSP